MKNKFAGQNQTGTRRGIAGEPGGHLAGEAQTGHAVRHPSTSFDGQSIAEAQEAGAVDAPGHLGGEAQKRAAGGEPLAGQASGDAHNVDAGEKGAGHSQRKVETPRSVAATRATISQIIEIGRRNSFAIRQRMRVKQATLSYVARTYYGYHTGLKDTERKKAMDGAAKLIKAIEGGEDHPEAMLIHATSAAAEPWLAIESDTERALVKLARQLPAYAWVKEVKGFGDLSFARIIAETGDLSGYANPGKVWKRLGLAVYDGKAQRRTRDAEKAVEQGYSPRRRSVVFVAFDPVIRAQSVTKESVGHSDPETHLCSADGEAVGPDHPTGETHAASVGPYRAIYDLKKSEYLSRGEAGEEGWSKLHADRAAKRFASKRLLKDLWSAWRDDIAGQVIGDAQTARAGESEAEAAIAALEPTRTVPSRSSRNPVAGQSRGEAQGAPAGNGAPAAAKVDVKPKHALPPRARKAKQDVAGQGRHEAHKTDAGD